MLISFISAALYGFAGVAQALTLNGSRRFDQRWISLAGLIAVVIHTYTVYLVLHPGVGIQLSLFPVSSLIAWQVAALVLLSSWRKPLHNLFIVLFPLAAVCELLAAFAPATAPPQIYEAGMVSHILSAILAYSVFTIAAVQAILTGIQERRFKHHHPGGIASALPPLQVMERLLFETLWYGQILLTFSLVVGFLFIEDIFAQHLVHKTVFSMIAWLIYSIILWGRYRWGWRGMAAVRWTLGGFVMLMLAFFGTKLVLEVLV